MAPIYDTIGLDYANLRRPDPRIAAVIDKMLGDARRVLNVGAGTGNYEPGGREVVALEPSAEMIAQRPAGAAPVVQGSAEALPFADRSFDAAMGVLTVHHWTDPAKGLAEMRRVARGPVVLLTELDAAHMPPLSLYGEVLGPVEIIPLPIPHDCTDGFLYAYWRRPHAYLDQRVRQAISSFWKIDAEAGLARLAADLESGAWEARYGDLLRQDAIDGGYCVVVSRGRAD